MKTILSINSTYSTTYGINHTDNALWKYKVYYMAALLYKPVTSSYWILPFCTSLTYFKKPVVCYLLFWLYYTLVVEQFTLVVEQFTLVEELDGYSLIEAHVLCLYFRITVEYFSYHHLSCCSKHFQFWSKLPLCTIIWRDLATTWRPWPISRGTSVFDWYRLVLGLVCTI